jgi:hypothetical protein
MGMKMWYYGMYADAVGNPFSFGGGYQIQGAGSIGG